LSEILPFIIASLYVIFPQFYLTKLKLEYMFFLQTYEISDSGSVILSNFRF